MKILSWNVNGLRSIIKKGFIDVIKKIDPDIIMLQEIRTNIVPIEFFNLPYKVYINSCKTKPGYSGVMTLSKTKPINVIYGIGEEKFDVEGRVINLEFEKFYLINVYFPNAGVEDLRRLDFKLEFNKKFEEYILSLKKPVIIGGDFNVAHLDIDVYDVEDAKGHAGFTDEEREWFSNFIKNGYIDVLRYFYKSKGYYTWYPFSKTAREKNMGWRIDYFLVSKDLINYIEDIRILKDIEGSDHVPLILYMKDY